MLQVTKTEKLTDVTIEKTSVIDKETTEDTTTEAKDTTEDATIEVDTRKSRSRSKALSWKSNQECLDIKVGLISL